MEPPTEGFLYPPIKSYGDPLKSLGKGTYGEVSKYEKGGRMYAIKSSDILDVNDVLSKDLLNEIAVYSASKHPNILEMVDVTFALDVGKAYLVLEFAEYGTLKDALESSKCYDLRSLIYQMLCGVSYLHHSNVMHRDLKPQNILVRDGCKLKIADLGMSSSLSCSTDKAETQEVTTIWYRAPEILLGGKYVAASDVWSVGCIIYELLTGRPFITPTNDQQALVAIVDKIGHPSKIWSSWEFLPKANMIENLTKFDRDVDLFQNFSPDMKIMLESIFQWNPERRPIAYELLRNPNFDSVRDTSREYAPRTCVDALDMYSALRVRDMGIEMESSLRSVKEDLLWVDGEIGIENGAIFYCWQLLDLAIPRLSLQRSPSSREGSEELFILGIAVYSIATSFVFSSKPNYETNIKNLEKETLARRPSTIHRNIREEIKRSIVRILKAVDMRLIMSTGYNYVEEYGDQIYASKIVSDAKIILTLTILLDLPDRLDPKEVGLMAIMLSCIYNSTPIKHTVTKRQVALQNSLLAKPYEDRGYLLEYIAVMLNEPIDVLFETLRKRAMVVAD